MAAVSTITLMRHFMNSLVVRNRCFQLFPATLLANGAAQIAECCYHFRVLIRSEEHTSELQSRGHLVCRLLLEKKKPQPAQRLSSLPPHYRRTELPSRRTTPLARAAPQSSLRPRTGQSRARRRSPTAR